MDKPMNINGNSPFEQVKQINEDGQEFWLARDLMNILGYAEYRNFQPAINKAMTACENSGENTPDHFVQLHEMVDIGSNAKKLRENYMLSRYGCYLIVQNADPSKPMVALGQAYFAIQTRKQELFEQSSEDEKRLMLREEVKKHNTFLASAAKDSGVETTLDFAIFQNHGYKGLYGGLDTKDIHGRKGLKKSQKILDHMGSTELAANLFRATQTEEKLRRDNIKRKDNANQTHFDVGKKVRQTISELGGTMPENMPATDSIKKLERQKQKLLKGKED